MPAVARTRRVLAAAAARAARAAYFGRQVSSSSSSMSSSAREGRSVAWGAWGRAPFTVEPLESREMLTVVTGTSSPGVTHFDFNDGSGSATRVDVQGNIKVELIGSNNDAFGNVGLNNLPGDLSVPGQPTRRVFGGRGGVKGVLPVTALNSAANPPTVNVNAGPATTTIQDIASIPDPLGATDPAFANARVGGDDGLGTFGGAEVPSQLVTLNALASNGAGQTFAFNVVTVPVANGQRILVQLVQLDNTTGRGIVVEDLNRDNTPFTTQSANDLSRFGGYLFAPFTGTTIPNQVLPTITTADFSPTDDTKLYFVATVQVNTGPTASITAPRLFVYDFTKPLGHRVSAVPGSFGSLFAGGQAVSTVSGISFNPNDGSLWVLATVPNNTGNPVQSLFRLAPGFTNTDVVATGGTPVTGLGGATGEIEFVGSGPGDINNDPTGVYVVNGTTLSRIDISRTVNVGGVQSFASVNLGPLPDPDDGRTPPRGTNVNGLTYNATLLNPFFILDDATSRRRGVLLGTDTTTDELLFVDFRNRFPTSNLFTIYVTLNDPNGSTTDGKVSISHVTFNTDGTVTYTPYDGTVGFNSGFFANPPAITMGLGGVLVGATNGAGFPVNSATTPSTNTFALLPNLTTVSPGLITAPDVNLDTFLLGGTITGQVYIANSINTFYAGGLAVGNASGGVVPTFSVLNNFNTFAGSFGFIPDAPALNNPANFYVGGDLRELIIAGQAGIIGDALVPNTNFYTQLDVEGRTGEIRVGAESGIRGVFRGQDRPQGLPGTIMQREIEQVGLPPRPQVAFWQDFLLSPLDPGTPGFFRNDTPATAQYLGTINTNALGPDLESRHDIIQVRGKDELGNAGGDDDSDNYAVGLLAGQVYSFQIAGMSDLDPQSGVETPDVTKWTYTGLVAATVTVTDPDGRVVASNRNFVDSADTAGGIFSFKADRPGIYTITVNAGTGGTTPYELTVYNVGKMALGAIHATGAIGDPRSSLFAPIFISNSQTLDTPGIETGDGDFGIFQAEGEMVSGTTNFLTADNGSIHVIQALDMGRITVTPIPEELTLGFFGSGIDVFAPHGSIGLVRNTDTSNTSILSLNRNNIPDTAEVTFAGQVFAQPIGGDYQEIQSPGGFFGNVLADGNIGVVQVGDLAFTTPSIFAANFDQSGAPGVIDLISTSGSSRSARGEFGTLAGGGPALSTGPGGNVRYIVPNDYTAIFVDRFFGGGTPIDTTFTTGVPATFVDDSGSTITATPSNLGPNPGFNQLLPEDPIANPRFLGEGTLSAILYPVRGSGGSVLVRLISTTGVALASGASRSNNSSVEIGRLEVSAALSGHSVIAVPVDRLGRPVFGVAVQPTEAAYDAVTTTVTNPNGGTTVVRGSVGTLADGTQATAVATAILLRPGGTNVLPGIPPGTPGTVLGTNVTMDGSAAIDVFNIVQNDAPTVALDSIINSTGGEIVNSSLVGVGTFQSSGNIGIGKSSTGTLVRTVGHVAGAAFPNTVLSAANPLSPVGIVATDNIAILRSSREIGTVVVGVFAGAATIDVGNVGELTANFGGSNNANVFEGIGGNVIASGRINTINLGEGLAPTGSGAVSQAGIYTLGEIGTVQNTNSGGDIRGTIASQTGIISIDLHNANIVGALIEVPVSLLMANLFSPLLLVLTTPTPATFDNPILTLGSVNVSGNGGMIGSAIEAQNIGPINISKFLFNSEIAQAGAGVQGDVNVGGYGIRAVRFVAFTAGAINATGNGSQLSTDDVSASVRRSEGDLLVVDGNQLDPFFLSVPSRITDIHAFLGTSSAVPVIPNVTNTGVIEDMDARFARDLGSVRAWQIRGSQPAQVRLPNIPIQIFPTTGAATVINAGNSIGSISTISTINGLQVTTGTLKSFNPGSDVLDTVITVSSKLSSLNIRGSLADNSIIRTVGPNSTIGTINIARNLDGRIETTGKVGTITIGGNLNGAIVITATSFGKNNNALDKLVLNGLAVTGSFQVTGNVGSITAANSLGQVGDQITITGNLGSLTVGSNKRTNANLAANLTVNGTLGTLKVTGRIDGAMHVLGNLNKFTLTNDGASRGTNILTNTFRVDGQFKSAKVTGGNVSSPSFSAFNLGSLQVSKGNVAPGATVSSDTSIGTFSVKGGSLLGSLLAANGTIKSASVSGNLGNGVNPLAVQAQNVNKLRIGGSMFSQTTITVPGTIGDLSIGGEMQAGSVIDAGAIRKLRIGGARNGTINVG